MVCAEQNDITFTLYHVFGRRLVRISAMRPAIRQYVKLDQVPPKFLIYQIPYHSKQYSVVKQTRQCTYNVTLRRVSVTTVTVEKQCVTYSGCVCVALVVQHAHHIFLRCIILSSVACHNPPHSSTLSHKKKNF